MVAEATREDAHVGIVEGVPAKRTVAVRASTILATFSDIEVDERVVDPNTKVLVKLIFNAATNLISDCIMKVADGERLAGRGKLVGKLKVSRCYARLAVEKPSVMGHAELARQ